MQDSKKLKCSLCGHEWYNRKREALPTACPNCKRYDWKSSNNIIEQPEVFESAINIKEAIESKPVEEVKEVNKPKIEFD